MPPALTSAARPSAFIPGAAAPARSTLHAVTPAPPRFALPGMRAATAQLLTEGGDDRIRPDAFGFNRYGCASLPDAGIVELGSSTASALSPAGFDAAARLLGRLAGRPESQAAEAGRIRRELLALTGAERVDGSEAVLAASGTDVHLIAITLAAGPERAPVQAVMADGAETGSGVPLALDGRHFGSLSCRGTRVARGEPVGALAAVATPRQIALREADGQPRPADAVDADFEAAVDAVVRQGERCLLVLTDVSKTGLVAPSADCAARLAARYGARLTVLVDGCQFRLAPGTVADHLARGFAVAVTGSKFVGGPAFSGALLLPAELARRARGTPLDELRGYSGRADWPLHWPGATALDTGANPGLLLRWEAALAELRRFAALAPGAADGFLADWGAAVAARLAAGPQRVALAVPALARGHDWDARQTVFPFIPLDAAGRPLAPAQVAQLHRQLAGLDLDFGAAPALRVRLGQPVAAGLRDGLPASALRICASARLVSDALASPAAQAAVMQQTQAALDRLDALLTAPA
ncbi:hypothetical protein [Derxia lacustris]|uniref:hypothetical protein n=1 Tax=Derxia lacustris TaxID=764842 RepID=UPI000A16FD04|nr:hypothetical protein [Derxia lacustris]